jgi:hypothetical protein
LLTKKYSSLNSALEKIQLKKLEFLENSALFSYKNSWSVEKKDEILLKLLHGVGL